MSERDIGRRTGLRTAGAGPVAALRVGSAAGAETDTAADDGGDETNVPVHRVGFCASRRTVNSS